MSRSRDKPNLYAGSKYARTTRYGEGRRWKPIDRHELLVWIALLIYIGLSDNSNIGSYWSTNKYCIHRPMQLMPWYRFEQIKRYFHVSKPTDEPISWYMKLSPLFEHLRTQFKVFCVLSQNVSVDEMMKAFTGRSAHTVKMNNKPVSEGFKMWALADRGYVWHFMWHLCVEGIIKKLGFSCI